MKDIVTPVPPEEVRSMIKKSLETAALVNYTRLSEEAKIDGKPNSRMQFSISKKYQLTFHFVHSMFQFEEDLRGDVIVLPAKKLEDLIHLTELCVDLLQQNEEHYAEVSARIHTNICCHFQESAPIFLTKSKQNKKISLEADSFG